MYNRGTKYLENNRPDKAIQCLKKAIQIDGDHKEHWLNLGNAYRLQDNYAEAWRCYFKSADPSIRSFQTGKYGEYDLVYSNMGLLKYAEGNDDAAIEYYTKCLSINPMHFDCIWNYANALLRKYCSRETVPSESDMWKMYSYRFKRSNPVKIDNALPRWDGFSKVDKICVLAEQGFGDKLMFGRYISHLRNYCDEIWVQCPDVLDCIFNDYKICRDSSDCVNGYGVPICSLAQIFGSVDSDWLKGKFNARKFSGERLKIGVVWSGSNTHANNRNRSIPSGYFTRFAKYGDLYYLSPGKSNNKNIISLDPKSWQETAEAVNGLDLVITVDTSIVHFCGSLGKECWMMQPLVETDFRWGRDIMGYDNIWYNTVKVFRNPNNWETTLSNVEEQLSKLKDNQFRNKIVDMAVSSGLDREEAEDKLLKKVCDDRNS